MLIPPPNLFPPPFPLVTIGFFLVIYFILFFNILFFFNFIIIYFIYLFLAALGLYCCTRAFSSCDERGLLFVAVRGLLIAVASLVAERGR